jgi:hypothetical protein
VNVTKSSIQIQPRLPAFTSSKRDVKKVPFVEMVDGRLQGIVSSGSDIERVYVSYWVAGTMDMQCSTNNNRPCGGLRTYPCNHLRELLVEAREQYGFEQVVKFLRPPGDPDTLTQTFHLTNRYGKVVTDPAGDVFSRFLSHLQLLELPTYDVPLHTMTWFTE